MWLSALPSVQAKPALLDAIALKPSCCSAFAVPTSNGFGITKQPFSCSLRKAARLSAVVSGIALSRLALVAIKIAIPGSGHNLAQKCPLLGEDEPVLLGEIEVGRAFRILAQPRAIGLVGRKAPETDQRESDVVGAFMRHE